MSHNDGLTHIFFRVWHHRQSSCICKEKPDFIWSVKVLGHWAGFLHKLYIIHCFSILYLEKILVSIRIMISPARCN